MAALNSEPPLSNSNPQSAPPEEVELNSILWETGIWEDLPDQKLRELTSRLNRWREAYADKARIEELQNLPLGKSSVNFNITNRLDNIDLDTLEQRISALRKQQGGLEEDAQ